MKARIASILILAIMVASCATQKAAQTPSTYELRVTDRTELLPVPVTIQIPEVVQERTTPEKESFLENEYATSRAEIRPDGTLYHDLRIKAKVLSDTALVPQHFRDSIAVQTITELVPVEKHLTFFQQLRMNGFWILLALLLWAYRGPIIEFIKKILGLFKP